MDLWISIYNTNNTEDYWAQNNRLKGSYTEKLGYKKKLRPLLFILVILPGDLFLLSLPCSRNPLKGWFQQAREENSPGRGGSKATLFGQVREAFSILQTSSE